MDTSKQTSVTVHIIRHEMPRYKSKHDAFTVLPLHTTTRHICRAAIYATWMATTRRST